MSDVWMNEWMIASYEIIWSTNIYQMSNKLKSQWLKYDYSLFQTGAPLVHLQSKEATGTWVQPTLFHFKS